MSPELETALRELQDATGLAMASFVSQVMEYNVDAIKGVTQAALIAKGQPSTWLTDLIQRSLREAMEREGIDPSASSDAAVVTRAYRRRKDSDGKA
jgi:hypothetical protein